MRLDKNLVVLTALCLTVSPGGAAAEANRVLFAGRDATGNINLWVTNGTSAGTRQLTVAGAGGVTPLDITAFAGRHSSKAMTRAIITRFG